MREVLLTVRIANEQDVVMVRQRADQIAGELSFSRADATRIATAVSEIARNALQYAGGGKVEFVATDDHERGRLDIFVSDSGGGIQDLGAILEGRYQSSSGLGLGIVGSRRLMDELDIETSKEGTTIRLTRWLPEDAPALSPERTASLVRELTRGRPRSPIEEIQRQNQELLGALDRERVAREEAEAANRARDDFFALLSHELRTPLTSILGWTSFLKDAELGTEEATAISSIRKSGEALSNLIDQLLEVSRILTGKIKLEREVVELNEIVREASDMLRPAADSKRMNFETRLSDGPARLEGDRNRLRQVVWNLLSNAIKFTPEGGDVSVHLVKGDGEMSIVVRDTGIGIDQETLPLIFERLHQADGVQASQGLGLGLSLVKHYVDLHGGSVSAESQGEGSGASFVVTLPVE